MMEMERAEDCTGRKRLQGEAILRYCPHVGENVVLLRMRTDGPDRFSCLRFEHCPLRHRVSCIGSVGETEQN